jgi:hypothetical protein
LFHRAIHRYVGRLWASEAEQMDMRFTLADALESAERIVRGVYNDDVASAQQRAMREDSIPNLVRDMVAETLSSLVRKLRRLPPPD